MLLSAVSVLVVVQSSSEIPEGLMNNPVCTDTYSKDSNYKVIVLIRASNKMTLTFHRKQTGTILQTFHLSQDNTYLFA